MGTVTCDKTGKVCMSRKEALGKATWYRRTYLARMNHYKCKHCGRWHIGHNYRKPKNHR